MFHHFSILISSCLGWRNSATVPLKCFQTKPIKRIMQMLWKCAPLTVWGATDNQTTALSCAACILLSSATLWIVCLGGAVFRSRLIWFIFSQCLFFCWRGFVACLKRQKVSGCKDDSCILLPSERVFVKSAPQTRDANDSLCLPLSPFLKRMRVLAF